MVCVCASVFGGELTPAKLATLKTNINNHISVSLVTPLCAAVTLLEVTTPGLGIVGMDCQIVLLGERRYAPSRPGSSQQMPSDLTVICRPLPPVWECSLLELTCHFGTSGTSWGSKGHSPPTLPQSFFMNSPLRLTSLSVGWQWAPAPLWRGWLGHGCWMGTSCNFCHKPPFPKPFSLNTPCLNERIDVCLCWNT